MPTPEKKNAGSMTIEFFVSIAVFLIASLSSRSVEKVSVLLSLVSAVLLMFTPVPEQGTPLRKASESRLVFRLVSGADRIIAASALLSGLYISMMAWLFAAAPYQRLGTASLLAGIAGTFLAGLLLLAGRIVSGEISPLASLRVTVLTALVAFFPFSIGDSETILFSLIVTIVHSSCCGIISLLSYAQMENAAGLSPDRILNPVSCTSLGMMIGIATGQTIARLTNSL